MNKTATPQQPKAYREVLEHIAHLCKVTRLCFETQADESAAELDFLRLCEEMTTEIALPAVAVRERFALSGFEYFCVMLGISAALEGNSEAPTFATAISHYPFAENENVYAALSDNRPLALLFDMEDGCAAARRFKLKSFLFNFIIQNNAPICSISFSKFPVLYDELCNRGVDFLSSNRQSLVVINGKTGSGRRTLAAQICDQLGKNAAVIYSDDKRTAEDLTGIFVLTDAVPVIIAEDDVEKAISLVNRFSSRLPAVFLCVNSDEKQIYPHERSCLSLKIPPLDKRLCKTAWDFYLGDSGVDAELLARRYRLTVGAISDACSRAGGLDVNKIAERVLSLNSESPICRLIHPMFRLEDLVAQEQITGTLKRIIKTAERLPQMLENCGFEKLFPYGRGLGVLFYGASGTGKTMSAYILAAELGLEVMRVDLSRIEDKYIGETEKRISEVFQKAEQNNCLLFFDEADSLFAKRTEVTDSHDRHANAQTAHLLQKMEEYSGIVVLSTNLEGNIDPAFRRRLQFALEFMKPSAEMRAVLWRKFIPAELLQEEIDFDFLGKAFDLTPAEIKWAALSAAVLADDKPLSTQHMITALMHEYKKFGISFPNVKYKKINLEVT